MTTTTISRMILAATGTVALAFAGTVAISSPAYAAPFSVTTEVELRDAIDDANLNPDHDVITLAADIALTASLPPITEDLEVVGAGHTIDGNGNWVFWDDGATGNINLTFTGVIVETAAFSINTDFSNVTITDSDFTNASVNINGNGVTITVTDSDFNDAISDDNLYVSVYDGSDVTVTRVTANRSGTSDGLDLNVEDFSTLTLTDSSAHANADHGVEITVDYDSTATISGTSAHNNGDSGFRVDPDYDSVVTIEESSAHDNVDHGFDLTVFHDSTLTLTNNTALRNGHSGFYIYSNQQSTVTASGLTATGNTDDGLYLISENDSTTTFSDSTFTDSADGYGVAVLPRAESTVALTSVTVSGNEFGGVLVDDEGYVDDNSTVTIVDSTIASNNGSGLDIYTATSTDTVVRGTTISGNSQSEGAGIYAELFNTSKLTVTNSTISGNQQSSDGAVFVVDTSDDTATVSISHSTIVNNVTSVAGDTGGISIANVDFTLNHSIVAGNTSDGAASDLRFDPQSLPTTTDINYSLVQNSTDDALTAVDAGTGNLKDIPALLGPLANNGGPTLTHLPLAGSPVVGAGNPAIAGAPAIDQRGQNRVVGTIEMGAAEVQAALAATGVDATPLIVGGGTLLALGGVIVFLVARRMRTVR